MEALGDEKSLTVVERDRTEQDVQPFAAQRPCQAARHDVDIAGALKKIDRGDGLDTGLPSRRNRRADWRRWGRVPPSERCHGGGWLEDDERRRDRRSERESRCLARGRRAPEDQRAIAVAHDVRRRISLDQSL